MLTSGALVATILDLRTRRIPNALTATMAGAGIGLAAAGISGLSLAAAVLGLVIGFALMLPRHLLGPTGAGDVKLMGAVGAIVGPALVFKAFLFTAVVGGVLALVVAIQRGRLSATLSATARMIATPGETPGLIRAASPSSRFAYGPAIAIGSVLAALVK